MENIARARLVSRLWLGYAAVTIFGSLLVLAIYVNAYDNTGMTERLRAAGVFLHTVMQVLSFPLGLALGAAANPSLAQYFRCGAPDDPCAVFIDWWTHFAAILIQIAFFNILTRRWRAAKRLG